MIVYIHSIIITYIYMYTCIHGNMIHINTIRMSGSLLMEGNVQDFYIFVRFVGLWVNFDLRDLLCNIHAFRHSSEYSVLVV